MYMCLDTQRLYYDETDKQCIQVCDQTEYFNKITNTCEFCPLDEYLNEKDLEKIKQK